ncbi:MAG: YihY/virulence factor BrkB family protein [Deltaproteobacteria bacterium]|nr:YihY/virulence factor BrkB family protein [Deltaproteobacteria bacterium]
MNGAAGRARAVAGWARLAALYSASRARNAAAVAWDSAAGFVRDDCFTYSAAITFYFILSFVPLLMILLSLGGFVLEHIASGLDGEEVLYRKILDYMDDFLPFVTLETVNRLTVVVRNRQTLGIAGAAILLLSSTGAFGALEQAVRRIFQVRQRQFVIQRLIVAGLVFGLGFVLSISIFLTSLFAAVLSRHVPELFRLKEAIASFPVVAYLTPLALLLIAFVFVMKFFIGGSLHWRHTFAGGAAFAVLFTLAREGFRIYLDRLTNLNALYGSLTAVIVLIIWVYYLTMVVLLSAEFMRALRDRAAGEGQRGTKGQT